MALPPFRMKGLTASALTTYEHIMHMVSIKSMSSLKILWLFDSTGLAFMNPIRYNSSSIAKKSIKIKAPAASGKPLTVQRTYRFNTELFESFEEDCARHLANPKLVLEALILHWLEGDVKTRSTIAMRHRRRFGLSSQTSSSRISIGPHHYQDAALPQCSTGSINCVKTVLCPRPAPGNRRALATFYFTPSRRIAPAPAGSKHWPTHPSDRPPWLPAP